MISWKSSIKAYLWNITEGLGAVYIFLLITFFPLVCIGSLLKDQNDKIILVYIESALCFVVFIRYIYKATQDDAKRGELMPIIMNLINANNDLLAKESLKKQDYVVLNPGCRGRKIYIESWIRDFVNETIMHNLDKNERKLFAYVDLYSVVKNAAISAKEDYLNSVKYYEGMTGVCFEQLCETILTKNGWQVNVTKASGDQGVDLIASKDYVKVAIQCKKYQRSVGNRAVQEISAGAKHYGIVYPIVVTNSTYTKSAYELAESNGVLLLHFSELELLSNKLQSRV